MIEFLLVIGMIVVGRLLFVLVFFLIGCVASFFYKNGGDW